MPIRKFKPRKKALNHRRIDIPLLVLPSFSQQIGAYLQTYERELQPRPRAHLKD
jgi:hypothetical protein